jgi:hypothetical protein
MEQLHDVLVGINCRKQAAWWSILILPNSALAFEEHRFH